MTESIAKRYSCPGKGVFKILPRLSLASLSAMAFAAVVSTAALCQLVAPAPASAQVLRDDQPKAHGLSGLPDVPLSVWRDAQIKPRAVAVCVHGLVMHGRVYDHMARTLARQGFVVYSQDLRGFGRWQEESLRAVAGDDRPAGHGEQSVTMSQPDLLSDDGSTVAEVSYDKSFEDLKQVIKAAHYEHPSLPLFLIGESLGAGLAIHAAQVLPEDISGLVLSSPALKRRLYVTPEVVRAMVKDYSTLVTNPHKQCDLVPYIRSLSSEDPRIVDEELNDPYVRKHLTCNDMLNTFALIKSNLDYAKGVPDNIPVLVIQGDQDRILKQNAVVLLLDRLKCKDQTVRWLNGKGHVLIETALVEPSTLGTITNWLTDHLPEANAVEAQNPVVKETAQSN